MRRNIGIIDQVVRAILGLACVALIAGGTAVSTIVFLIAAGAYLLATAIVTYCPIYALLKVSTYGRLDRLV